MKNETGSSNFVFPHHRKTVGTKVHAFDDSSITVYTTANFRTVVFLCTRHNVKALKKIGKYFINGKI